MRRLWLLPPVIALAGLSIYVIVLSQQVKTLSERAIANEVILAQSSLLPPEEDAKCSRRQHSYGLIDEESLLASVGATHTDIAIPGETFVGACEYSGTTYQLYDRTGLEFNSRETEGDSWAVAMSTDDGWEILNFTTADTSADSPQCFFSSLFAPVRRGERENLHIECESVQGGSVLGTGLVQESFVVQPAIPEVTAWYSCVSEAIVISTPDNQGVKQINNVTCTSVYEQGIEE
ncbi:hypothetical protein KBC55_01530 [Patescibacteria group bacterium]|nr:hypothetical protein [Patescibacteria group bacterium]